MSEDLADKSIPTIPPRETIRQVTSLFAEGKIEAVAEYALELTRRYPSYGFFWKALGTAYQQLGLMSESITALENALCIDPYDYESLLNCGVTLHEVGRYAEALDRFGKAIVLQVNRADGYYNAGNARKALQVPALAATDFTRAVALDPVFVDAWINLGNCGATSRERALASASYDRAVILDPSRSDSLGNRGIFNLGQRDFGASLRDLVRTTLISPRFARAHGNLGGAMREAGMHRQSLPVVQTAVVLDPADPQSLNNFALSLLELTTAPDAMVFAERSFRVDPFLAEASNTCGSLFLEMGRIADALRCFETATSLRNPYPDAEVNKSLAMLLAGDLTRGFEKYEYRWILPDGSSCHPCTVSNIKAWVGNESLQGKSICLSHEQGYGDTLQFCRYIPLVLATGARVTLHVPVPLVRLLSDNFPQVAVIASDESVSDTDFQCPFLSLPFAFGTSLATIPCSDAPYLKAEPAIIARWADRVVRPGRPRVGVVWNGGSQPNRPDVAGVLGRRNIPLMLFAEYLDVAGIDFYSLQKGDPAESEIRGREAKFWRSGRLANFAAELTDFAETAGLIANLDLVICVDTATAHLSAALGKPTWILNRHDTCWRWFLDREDSPWYPSVKLYRQGPDREWGPVLSRVRRDLLANFR